jgi:hypothetical protein
MMCALVRSICWQRGSQRRRAAERHAPVAEARLKPARRQGAGLRLGSASVLRALGALTVALEIRSLAQGRHTIGDVVEVRRER